MTYDKRSSGGISFFVILVVVAMAGMTAALAYKTTEAGQPSARVFVPVATTSITK